MKKRKSPPFKWTLTSLEQAVEGYFDLKDQEGKPYTVSGLARHLEIDRKTLVFYSHDEDYQHVIRKAKTRIEEQLEERALSNEQNVTFTTFNLKNNFGWQDKTEIRSKTEVKNDSSVKVLVEKDIEEAVRKIQDVLENG